MAEHVAPRPHYDLLWDQGHKKRRLGRSAQIGIGLSIAAHLGLGWYVYETKFVPVYREYSDDAIIAELTTLPKPPPPPEAPPPETPAQRPPPPPATDINVRRSIIDLPSFSGPIIPLPPEVAPTPPEPPIVVQNPPRPPPRPVISNADWLTRPSGEDVARYYPERALRMDVPGRVVLQCEVTARGSVTACTVMSEDPVQYGFGDAALKLSRLFRMRPKTADGQAVEGAMVTIPVAFKMGR